MPPKAKFKREEVINAALKIVEREGLAALTARSLANELGSSARPVFTVFRNMEEVVAAVYREANAVYAGYVEQGLGEDLAFRGVGRAYIRFAVERPRLFRLLFMQERSGQCDGKSILLAIEEHYEEIIRSIVEGYNVSRQDAIDLYLHLWVYSHGIAVLIVTHLCTFSEDQVNSMITQVFSSLLSRLKREGKL